MSGTLNEPAYFRTWSIFVILTSALAIAAGWLRGGIFTISDSSWYLLIAQGEIRDVIQPFAQRQLAPLLCRGLSQIFHLRIETAFLVLGICSIVVLVGVIGYLLVQSGADAVTLAMVGGLALWANLYNGLVLPDLLNAALLSFLLLFLFRRKYLAAALMLFPLYLSRDSTVLVLLCLLAAGWRTIPVRGAIAALLSAAAGISVVKLLTANAQPNREHIGSLLYLAGKVPWNFAKNILGLPLWLSMNPTNCAAPRWVFRLHFGIARTVGVCGYEPHNTLWTLRMMLAAFGILPIPLLLAWRRQPRLLWPDNVLFRFCIVYGILSFLIAPLIGTGVPRLTGYAFPLFVLVAPTFMLRYFALSRRVAVLLLALHLVVAWSPLMGMSGYRGMGTEAVLLSLTACAYALSWIILRRARIGIPAEPILAG